jgi:hypothetical protein
VGSNLTDMFPFILYSPHIALQWIGNFQIGAFLCQEVNVSFRHPKIQAYLRRSHCSRFSICTLETEWIFTSPNKPGGTFCTSNIRMRSCIIQQIQDQAGRLSGNIYQLKIGMKLALISLYQVVKHNINDIISVHSQQIAWLHKCS